MKAATIAGLAVGLSLACATSPTGRRQLMLMPSDQMRVMGGQAFQQIKAQEPVSGDEVLNGYVQCISQRILQTAHTKGEVAPPEDWEVVVFDDPMVNAFALPGGRIGVYRGMVELAETPGQLAAVIGHEIGHVMADHGNERVSQAFAAQGALAAIGALTEGGRNRDLVLAALGVGAQVGVLLPFGRAQEREADIIGLQLMADAGFDPRDAVGLWERMAQMPGARPPQFLSTHPDPADRIQVLEGSMDDALARYEQAAPRRAACPRPAGIAERALGEG